MDKISRDAAGDTLLQFSEKTADASARTIRGIVERSGRDPADVLAMWADDVAQRHVWQGATLEDVEPAWSAPGGVVARGLGAVRRWAKGRKARE